MILKLFVIFYIIQFTVCTECIVDPYYSDYKGHFICTNISDETEEIEVPLGKNDTFALDLHIKNSTITLLKPLFSRLSNVESLTLESLGIEEIKPEVFQDLKNLTFLDLSKNRLYTVSVGVFDQLGKLTHLWLSQNLLTTVPAGLFNNLEHLEVLRLNTNLINQIDDEAFSNLTSLQDLYLNKNNITSLQEQIFKNLTHLLYLDVSYNPLKQISDTGISDTIKHFLANGLSLTSFDTNFTKSKLWSLFLSNNQLKEFDFSHLSSKLDIVDLSFNHISILKNFDLSAVNFTHIRNLKLQKNKIENLTTVSDPDNYIIEKINLSGNLIKVASCLGLSHLKMLQLRHNRIEVVEKYSFDVCKDLEILDLSYNKIEKIEPKAFEGANSLITLNLGNNNLKKISTGSFTGLNNLQILYWKNNYINSFNLDDLASDLPSLSSLKLDINRLFCDDLENIFIKSRQYHISLNDDNYNMGSYSCVKKENITFDDLIYATC